jgi:hypothetical protein
MVFSHSQYIYFLDHIKKILQCDLNMLAKKIYDSKVKVRLRTINIYSSKSFQLYFISIQYVKDQKRMQC